MLGDHDTIATLAVKDLQVARDFYEGVLGFAPRGDAPEGVLYGAGSGAFLVYPSSFAGTNRGTAMSFQVAGDRFDAEVAALRPLQKASERYMRNHMDLNVLEEQKRFPRSE